MPPPLFACFTAGASGPWLIERCDTVSGEGLATAPRLAVSAGPEPEAAAPGEGSVWALRGTVGNLRYTTRAEADALTARQEGLGRPEAVCAALIPIRKSAAWWALAQDERRAILEEQSRHIAVGLEYLPAVARRLHHSRELGEPFDFLTWFEYAPEHAAAFEELVLRLRATPEWNYVDREVDIRLRRTP